MQQNGEIMEIDGSVFFTEAIELVMYYWLCNPITTTQLVVTGGESMDDVRIHRPIKIVNAQRK